MSHLSLFTRDFEGKPFVTLILDGQPAWVARHLGIRLGFAHKGKGLANKILGEWSLEFEEGRDYTLISGDDVEALRSSAVPMEGLTVKSGRGLLLLYKPGFDLVVATSKNPLARRLRQFVEDEVLPFLPELERIASEGGPRAKAEKSAEIPLSAGIVLLPKRRRPRRSPQLAREERLARQLELRARWLDLSDRRFKVQVILRALDSLGDTLPEEVRTGMELEAVEIATGLRFGSLKIWPPQPSTAIEEAVRKVKALADRVRAAEGR